MLLARTSPDFGRGATGNHPAVPTEECHSRALLAGIQCLFVGLQSTGSPPKICGDDEPTVPMDEPTVPMGAVFMPYALVDAIRPGESLWAPARRKRGQVLYGQIQAMSRGGSPDFITWPQAPRPRKGRAGQVIMEQDLTPRPGMATELVSRPPSPLTPRCARAYWARFPGSEPHCN
jgi:hypothetical protein